MQGAESRVCLSCLGGSKMIVSALTTKNDEWYTPSYAVEPIAQVLKRYRSSIHQQKVLCPFDKGNSNFVAVLRNAGFLVEHSHIEDGKDFFSYTKEEVRDFDYIISNPPYSLKVPVFRKLFELEKPFAMLVGVVGLFDSKEKAELFAANPVELLYLNPRVQYFCPAFEGKISKPPYQSAYVCKNLFKNQINFAKVDRV